MVTASEDNSIKIFDIRVLKSVYTIAAHTSLVSDVKFFYSQGLDNIMAGAGNDPKGLNDTLDTLGSLWLASSSFDGTVKIWSADDWRLLHECRAHEGKVMSVDITQGN